MATNQWTKIAEGIRRNDTSGTLYANFRFKGKTFRQSLKTKDKTKARNKVARLRESLESAPSQNEEHTTVQEAAPRFLASLSGKSKSDIQRSSGHIKFFVEEFAKRNPREIKPMELQEWLHELREEREFAEDSWNKYAATFGKFWNFLIKNSFACENPAKSLDFLKAKAKRKYTPATEEIKSLLDFIEKKIFFKDKQETLDFIEFMVLTGQGRAEAVHAQWMDVTEDTINFYRQKTRAIAHQVPKFPSIKEFLERRLNGRKPEPAEPIFKIKSAKNCIAHCCEKLGIHRLGHHSFRRYFITQRLMDGVPPNIVAKWVGHKNSEMVMEIYSSIPTSFEKSFAEKIPAIK